MRTFQIGADLVKFLLRLFSKIFSMALWLGRGILALLLLISNISAEESTIKRENPIERLFHFVKNSIVEILPESIIKTTNAEKLFDFFESNIAPLLPEAYMTAPEMIRYHGYPVEIHTVTTEDGYLLELHRIPRGLNDTGHSQAERLPIIAVGDFFMSSGTYTMNLPHQSIGFLLADAGFDVWLCNTRGVSYSRKHVSLTPEDPEFWKFSLDEEAKYDYPAILDYVTEKTGHQSIYAMGQGFRSMSFLMMLSIKPKYSEKVKLHIALTPTGVLDQKFRTGLGWGCYNFIEFLGASSSDFSKGEVLGEHGWRNFFKNITEQPNYWKEILQLAVAPTAKFIINNALGKGEKAVHYKKVLVPGNYATHTARIGLMMNNYIGTRCMATAYSRYYGVNLNGTRQSVYWAHYFESSSADTIRHACQLTTTEKIGAFDWGREENLRRHGTEIAPLYDFSNVTTPLLVTWTRNDFMKGQPEVMALAKLFPKVDTYEIPSPGWTHMDYMWSVDTKEALTDYLSYYIKKFDKAHQPYCQSDSCKSLN